MNYLTNARTVGSDLFLDARSDGMDRIQATIVAVKKLRDMADTYDFTKAHGDSADIRVQAGLAAKAIRTACTELMLALAD